MEPQAKFFHRELSWLEFNGRVLAEAMDPTNPLLERLKFIGIVSSNLDEFFMVRVASFNEYGNVVKEVREKAYALTENQNGYFQTVMIPELEAAGIVRVTQPALTDRQFEFVRNLFHKEIFPTVTPVALSAGRPLPVLANLSLHMVVGLVDPASQPAKQYAIVEIPKNFPRMIALPAEKGFPFMFLEDVIALFSKELFLGYEIIGHGIFRITRAAHLTIDEETDQDFAEVMTKALQTRRKNDIVRLEVSGPKEMLEIVKSQLSVSDDKISTITSWIDLKGVSQIAFQPMFEELKRPQWHPRPVADFEASDDLWELLKTKDVAVMHPYESFDAVTRFVSEAAEDPDVLAIKQTLYRAGQDSPVFAALERAAMNGKQVTVIVELKARFDEEKNIGWAYRLENAGASVIYGLVGLKTHAKACLVVRREPEGIKRYAHLSTGNYNEKTSHIYSDIGIFTSNEELTNDLTVFFNMITGYSQPMALSKISVAPFGLRRKIKQLITRETMRSTSERPGLILAKFNSLLDEEIIEALYKASNAGVKIKLNVRGICTLRPGLKGLSENIEVTSIVDMFLEHSRMIYFANGGEEELYLSSADWMPRNFDRRIELLFPVESKEIKKELTEVLKMYFKDNMKSWRLFPDGRYEKSEAGTEKKFRAQEMLCKRTAEKTVLERSAPRELKPQRPRHAKGGG